MVKALRQRSEGIGSLAQLSAKHVLGSSLMASPSGPAVMMRNEANTSPEPEISQSKNCKPIRQKPHRAEPPLSSFCQDIPSLAFRRIEHPKP